MEKSQEIIPWLLAFLWYYNIQVITRCTGREEKMQEETIISVGIDIGTSTTSMVVSRLSFANTASCFTAPHVEITQKEILYRSPVYTTPQKDENSIDIKAVENILLEEYQNVGLTPERVHTGAVIITGESSRKENARLVTERMSRLAGKFVVASAGPDLEAVIAGKGSGAQAYSEDRACTAVNIDVGGGTSNIAVFQAGEIMGKACFDIGGRLVRMRGGIVEYVSPRLSHIMQETGIILKAGDPVSEPALRRLTDRMAMILGEGLGFVSETPLMNMSRTAGSSVLGAIKKADAIFFSGGVAKILYGNPGEQNPFPYGDIGVLLAQSLQNSSWVRENNLRVPVETISATVIGAGSYTTTVSGSTVSFTDDSMFPMKNIPAFTVNAAEEEKLCKTEWEAYRDRAASFLADSSAENILFVLAHTERPTYRQVVAIAESFVRVSDILPREKPLLILCRDDFAKALGMVLSQRLTKVNGRMVVCLDSIDARSGDYLDFGMPVMGGIAVPVVVKTLIFS